MALLEMREIDKSFNGVPVLKKASLTVERGEVHALLGENGAGKSTLMNILTGVLPYEGGEITFEGTRLADISVRRSEELGIAFVHQELNLFNGLKVFENIFLGRELTNNLGTLRKNKMIEASSALFQRLNVEIDPLARVEELSTSEKQLLEISKALIFNSKLLILDEPTASLNEDEVGNLFEVVTGLKEEGISFIFISHKMPEVFAYSDSYTVLRNGRTVGGGKIADTTPDQITTLMIGKNNANRSYYHSRELGEVVLSLNNYSGTGFEHVSLDVRRGEVLGITGINGSGCSELLQGLFGVSPKAGGSVTVRGRDLPTGSVHAAMLEGLALLPSNRKENSAIPDQTILENMCLADYALSRDVLRIDRKDDLRQYQYYAELLSIKAESPEAPILSLSGGNQQKVFVARWLMTKADILLLDNPTQGMDVGAKAEMYRLILEMAKDGKTILVHASEAVELQKMVDRCAVFYSGSIIAILPHDKIDERTLLMYSTNSAAGSVA